MYILLHPKKIQKVYTSVYTTITLSINLLHKSLKKQWHGPLPHPISSSLAQNRCKFMINIGEYSICHDVTTGGQFKQYSGATFTSRAGASSERTVIKWWMHWKCWGLEVHKHSKCILSQQSHFTSTVLANMKPESP